MSDEIFKIPSRLTATTLAHAYSNFANLNNNVMPHQVKFDFSQLNFAEPSGIVFLGNFIDFVVMCKSIIIMENLPKNSAVKRYLEDSQFFQTHFKLSSLTPLRSTTYNLTKMSAQKSPQWLENHFMPWMANATLKNLENLYPLSSSVSELFNNIQDHTTNDIGFIFAQHYPQMNEIKIALGDFGDGIPNSIRKIKGFEQLDDYKAILKATEEGITSQSKPTNRGRGLHQLLTAIVVGFKGEITIFSGKAAVRFYNLFNKIQNQEINHNGFCHGTTLEILIKPVKIPEYVDENEMTW